VQGVNELVSWELTQSEGVKEGVELSKTKDS
jgi:hypothetical protein